MNMKMIVAIVQLARVARLSPGWSFLERATATGGQRARVPSGGAGARPPAQANGRSICKIDHRH